MPELVFLLSHGPLKETSSCGQSVNNSCSWKWENYKFTLAMELHLCCDRYVLISVQGPIKTDQSLQLLHSAPVVQVNGTFLTLQVLMSQERITLKVVGTPTTGKKTLVSISPLTKPYTKRQLTIAVRGSLTEQWLQSWRRGWAGKRRAQQKLHLLRTVLEK